MRFSAKAVPLCKNKCTEWKRKSLNASYMTKCSNGSKNVMGIQMLKAAGNELFYHVWPTDNGKHNYEIDFLLSRGSKICPVEVKSSGYKSHASLDAFKGKFSSRILHSYLVYTKDLRKDGDTLLVPTFLTLFF